MDEEDEEKAIGVISQTEAFFRQNTPKVMEVKLFYSNMLSSIFERYHHLKKITGMTVMQYRDSVLKKNKNITDRHGLTII